MNESLYLSIKDKLNLRKLGSISLKINKEDKKFLIVGFILEKDNINLKINFLTNYPEDDSLEESIISNIKLSIENFQKEFAKEIEHGIYILKLLSQDKNQLSKDFKNAFTNALTDYSLDSQKHQRIAQAFKKVNKKLKSIEKVIEEESKLKFFLDKLQITDYHTYFSLARGLKRKLKLYIGPTNSGKTYQALNDLVSHGKGTYLSPLRLLAWEGQEEIEKRGFACSLITGEEKLIVDNAPFKAQTIETLNFSEINDAILIDEIQMLFDADRGWAWTQALVGAPCKELIMAGSPEAEPLVRKIANLLGEELEVISLNRFNPLDLNPIPYELPKDLNKLPEGSAVIAFSRKNVLAFKKFFESHNKPVSVIYGNLSPEVRKEEARKFREGVTKYLVSTDAIAMGLNLPISNVVFSTIEKFNGQEMTTLTPMEIKQIGGRAGRYGKKEKGEISALDKNTLKYIKGTINAQGKINDFLFIKPSFEHVKRISQELNTQKLFPILTFFTNKVMNKDSQLYVCANLEEQKEIALLLDKVSSLPLEDKFLFNTAPVPGDEHHQMFLKWIYSYEQNKQIPCPQLRDLNPRAFNYDKQLILEHYVKVLNLYTWFCYKKPSQFIELNKAFEEKEKTNTLIENYLSSKVKK